MSLSAPIGICAGLIQPLLCDGSPDLTTDPVVTCNLVDFQVTPVLGDALTIQEDSGVPGRRCLDIEVPAPVKYYDVTITTCSIYDPRLDNLLGYSDLIIDPASNRPIGSKAKALQEQECACDCGEEACQSRAALMLWSLNLCPNAEGIKQVHPDGRSWLTVLPMIQFQPNTNAIIQLSNQAQGRQYSGRTYTNLNFGQGPGELIPASEIPTNRMYYQFSSDSCPPSGCSCGECGSTPTPSPF